MGRWSVVCGALLVISSLSSAQETFGTQREASPPPPPPPPPLWDWRALGAVTPVGEQGNCGSSYAFAAAALVEAQWKIAGNSLESLSAEEFVACDQLDEGCSGGTPSNALQWLMTEKNGQLAAATAFPYTSANGSVPSCPNNLPGAGPATISALVPPPTNETLLAGFVATNGPVAVFVDATAWFGYTGGVLRNCTSNNPFHGALIVGYNLLHQPPFWTLKNSWGSLWGEGGYIRVPFGSNACGLVEKMVGATAPRMTTQPASPTSPAPPTPPTPVPQPNATFQQKVCNDSQCSTDCTTDTFPQNSCLQVQGGSAMVTCVQLGLQISLFPFVSDCSGWPMTSVEPVGVCGEDTEGSFLENICPPGTGTGGVNAPSARRASKISTTYFRLLRP